ncbi:hypothetical protein CPLU01_13616 [Colletotrichum plurivorum]|uniref:Uncharacterized protein n=1 Tax=Colletotrichum plurivorum TaxID=2175906 RepID=A0A8H6N2T4_9PEZI|nr:hypothetical protein CPLU01_13616 [Colletotrichum plurivorum]
MGHPHNFTILPALARAFTYTPISPRLERASFCLISAVGASGASDLPGRHLLGPFATGRAAPPALMGVMAVSGPHT